MMTTYTLLLAIQIIHCHVTALLFSIRYFTEAALEVHNCLTVQIVNSFFSHNRGTGIIIEPYRGNTGAVAITFLQWSTSMCPTANITITNSVFHNNSALAEESYRSSSDAILSGTLTGRGGGLGIFIFNRNTSTVVSGCRFTENYARSFGGGLYIAFAGNYSHFRGAVDNCSFTSNTAVHGGGGFINTVALHPRAVSHSLDVTNCRFMNNRGNAGGGMYYYSLFEQNRAFVFTLSSSVFSNNSAVNKEGGFGAAFAASMYEVYIKKEQLLGHKIINW